LIAGWPNRAYPEMFSQPGMLTCSAILQRVCSLCLAWNRCAADLDAGGQATRLLPEQADLAGAYAKIRPGVL